MAYQLKPHESIAAGLRRIVRTELRFAIDQLGAVEPSDEAIHEARKSIKKVRAVLKLCGGTLDARRVPRSLRRAAHLLAPVRDADAAIVTLSSLTTDQPGALSTKASANLREQLLQDKATIVAVARRDRVAKRSAKVLRGVRRSTTKWDWTSVGLSTLTVTVRRTYKRARKSMRTARKDGRADAFHGWRKQVKTLWYALRLLKERVPRPDRLLSDLKHLETWLGDDHNLWVLRNGVTTNPSGRQEAAEVLAAAERRQQVLKRRALAVGARVFRASPRDFAAQVLRKQ